jgi:hypothetical protein
VPTNFRDEWERIRRTGDIHHSPLFASSYVPSKRRTQKTSLTHKQAAQLQATYYPTPNTSIWAEYSGHSAHRTTGYSPILMEAKSRQAQAVFQRADYVLSRLREKW